MESLRESLGRLGWPVDALTDEQIAGELYRRWFACSESTAVEHRIGYASATGIFASMAGEGNLDALCWSDQDGTQALEDVVTGEAALLRQRPIESDAESNPLFVDRRKARRRARDLIDFVSGITLEEATGWLVDVSAVGVAFLAEVNDAPAKDAILTMTIHKREGQTIELGSGVVVRTESLSESLTLVCVQLDQSWEAEV